MNTKYLLACGIGAALILTIGCSTSQQKQTLLDRNWGRSFESAKFNQTLDPDAGKIWNRLTGLAGTSAENVVRQYEGSFSGDNSAQSGYNINLSGIGKK